MVERLVRHFTESGLRVAAIKHTSDEVGFDKPRSDSDRLKQAGAVAVGLVANSEIGLYTNHTADVAEEWLESTLARLPETPQLVIYEGYRGGPHPKIECILKPDVTAPSFTAAQGLIVVISDHPIDTDVPVLSYDPLGAIADAIRASFDRDDWPAADAKLH